MSRYWHTHPTEAEWNELVDATAELMASSGGVRVLNFKEMFLILNEEGFDVDYEDLRDALEDAYTDNPSA